jgi:hypothetical protein
LAISWVISVFDIDRSHPHRDIASPDARCEGGGEPQLQFD